MGVIFGQAGGEVYRSHFMLFFGFFLMFFVCYCFIRDRNIYDYTYYFEL